MPLMERSMSNKASMRFTASSATGEITGALLLRRPLAAIFASSKNYRLAWLQQSAGVIAPGTRVGIAEAVIAAIGVCQQDAGEVSKMVLRALLSSIPWGVVKGGGWRVAPERPVIPQICPNVARGLAGQPPLTDPAMLKAFVTLLASKHGGEPT
jgi:hypothetical protein